MSQSSGFDVSKLSTASKILLGAGIAYLIVLFLPWQKEEIIPGCCSLNGARGIGVLNLLLVIALIAWEVLAIAGVEIQAPRALVSAALAGGILLFTLLKILADNEAIYLFAWIGLILAIVIAYGGWMRWQEHQAGAGSAPPMPGAPPSDGGGFTS